MEHKVDAVMTSQVVTARPSTPFQELVRLLQQHRISALPVTDDNGRLVSIVSEPTCWSRTATRTAPRALAWLTCSTPGPGWARPPAPARPR
jgi:CBS-domain-containing membrane protein